MARHSGPVLVDTNVILEAHRVGAWHSLTGGCRVETVDDCVVETQTGFQKRSPEQQIHETELRAALNAVAMALSAARREEPRTVEPASHRSAALTPGGSGFHAKEPVVRITGKCLASEGVGASRSGRPCPSPFF